MNSSPAYDENFVRELILALWNRKVLIISFTAVCMIAALTASLIAAKKYEAVLVLLPVTTNSGGGSLSSLASSVSQLGGLASLAGLSIGGASGAKVESLATLQSETLTQRYIEDNNLLPILFADKWDSRLGNWTTTNPKSIPTLWKGKQFFRTKVRDVKENPKTGLVTLTITWTDPDVAARWANGLVELTNSYLRQKAIAEAERNIAYLNDQLTKTSVVALRDSIYSLMESEIKKQMLARGTDAYALKVIDPAVAPEKPSSPNKLLWMLAAFCVGLLLPSIFVFFHVIFYPQSRNATALG